ncbi:MAG: diacylglycerol kinase [Acidimicrobiales bacterium mtb01]|nr:thioesterase family protein [Actinomycetota bacterium]TEX45755.1 MAG: diacylglycerol kinase [Acidimicrobiales bacterium mtb01]
MTFQGDFAFDRAIAVERRDGDGSHVVFDAMVNPGWDIVGNANGGYLLAIVGRALSEATGRPDCVTSTTHYLSPCPAEPVVIEVEVIRSGRRFATAIASMRLADSGRDIVRTMATLGDLANDPGGPTLMFDRSPALDGSTSAVFPRFEDCVEARGSTVNDFARLHQFLGTRLDPRAARFREGVKSGEPVMRGWFEFADDRPVDSLAVMLAADAFPPAVFNLDLPAAWVPTVEMTVHVRAVPAPGPVACEFSTRFVQNGLLEEDGVIWDSAGTLVAQSRQLALAPRA